MDKKEKIMPKGLYIGSTTPNAGKNLLTVGIGQHLAKGGINYGFMRPVGDTPAKAGCCLDDDARFACEVLAIDDPVELISPVCVTQDFKMMAFSGKGKDQMPQIKSAYEKLIQNRDTILLSGSGSYLSNKFCELDSLRIIKELGLKAVFVDRVSHEADYNSLLFIKEILGDFMLGAVLNDVPKSFVPEVETVIKPFLERKGIKVLGCIQSDPLMKSIRASDLVDHLDGKLITAQNEAVRMVENFLIGTMQVENFMTYFRRNPNSAVIVGGDRADVQLVAIEGEAPCIILTGNLYPNEIILSRAETLKVPIIMVRGDTYYVAHKMENLLARYKMRDIKKVRQASQLVESALDFRYIYNALGLKD